MLTEGDYINGGRWASVRTYRTGDGSRDSVKVMCALLSGGAVNGSVDVIRCPEMLWSRIVAIYSKTRTNQRLNIRQPATINSSTSGH